MDYKYLGSVTLEQILSDVLTDYARDEIISEFNNDKNNNIEYKKKNKIKEYGAYNLKINSRDERQGAGRYDWDSITYKDDNGNLLDHIADSILATDDFSRVIAIQKAMCQIQENIYLYYKNEFEQKIEQEKSDFHQEQMQYGHSDYFEA